MCNVRESLKRWLLKCWDHPGFISAVYSFSSFFFANKAKLQCTLNRSNKRMLWRYHYFPYVFISQPGMFHAGQKRDYCHLAKHPFKRCSLLLCQHTVAFCSEGMDISIQTETSLVFFFLLPPDFHHATWNFKSAQKVMEDSNCSPWFFTVWGCVVQKPCQTQMSI